MRSIRAFLGTVVLFLATGLAWAEPPAAFFYKSGDRVLFLGDSITEQYQYSTDIELYLTTRFPKWNLVFINAGIGGDTAGGGERRFATHVLAEKPTALTIDFGMNDGGYGAFNANGSAGFARATDSMLKMAQKAGVRTAVISPNAVDRRVRDNLKVYFETQKQFYAPLKEVAAKNNVPFVDQYAITRAIIEKLEIDQAKAVQPFPDAVHTSSSGGLLMAHTILVGLNAPAVVSDVKIDASGSKAKTEACAVDNLKCASDSISFDRSDEALPFPVQNDWLSLLPYVHQLKDLNWYGLQVSGLGAGNYVLLVDGKAVGKPLSSEEWSKGVNLGLLTEGPIHAQGQKVFSAINQKNQVVHERFNNVVRFNAPDWLADVAKERKEAELKKRMDKIDAMQAEIYKLAQPVKHHFELKASK